MVHERSTAVLVFQVYRIDLLLLHVIVHMKVMQGI